MGVGDAFSFTEPHCMHSHSFHFPREAVSLTIRCDVSLLPMSVEERVLFKGYSIGPTTDVKSPCSGGWPNDEGDVSRVGMLMPLCRSGQSGARSAPTLIQSQKKKKVVMFALYVFVLYFSIINRALK